MRQEQSPRPAQRVSEEFGGEWRDRTPRRDLTVMKPSRMSGRRGRAFKGEDAKPKTARPRAETDGKVTVG